MGLRGRFTLWFALTALAVIAVVALVTRQVISKNYRDSFERRRADAESVARGEIARLQADVVEALRAVGHTGHPVVGGVLVDLKKYGELPGTERRRVRRQVEAVMEGLGLDLMFLIDDSGTVLASAHRRSEVDTVDRTYRERLSKNSGEVYFAYEPRLVDGTVQTMLVAEAVREVRQDGRSVVLVVGKALGPERLDAVRNARDVEARVLAADGKVTMPAVNRWDAPSMELASRISLAGFGGQTVATVEVAISNADLQQVLRRVTMAAAVLAGAAVLLATVLGFLVARGMSRDLDELVVGAQAIARGELAHQVTVRGRGEIGAVASAFNAMATELTETTERLSVAQRIAAWQEIARRLAHEIKNPLTPIQMSVETMRRTREKNHPSFDEIFDESTVTILEEVGRLKRIVSEFSEFARMPKPSKSQVDLNEVVAHTLVLYKGDGGLVERLDPSLPTIEADRDQLSQVILNLVENSRDALRQRGDSASGGHILVQTIAIPGGARLVIEDNGPGLSDQVKEKLFTPYFTTKHAAGGTGLGLAIVHRVVTDHGGKITAGDAPAGGARFTVDLPA